MKILSNTLLILSIFCSARAQDTLVDNYIQVALHSNLALQQKQADYNRAVQSLRSARALFFPDISVNSRYTVAQGGRIIDFPVGDLLNPVYSTLNALTQSQDFPQVENQEFPFYRPTEQETKLNVIQPVFDARIINNYRMENNRLEIGRTNVIIYKRELQREVKTAYYNYLKAVYLNRLVDETESLLQENYRVSKSLFDNDKVTLDIVYRSDAELQKVYLARAQAEQSLAASQSYFNFLLNRSLDTSIEVFEYKDVPALTINTEIDSAINKAVAQREELDQLSTYASLNTNYTKYIRSNNYPSIALAFNYGFQGEEYSFTSEDDFMLASVVLQWNISQGFKTNADVQKARIASEQIELKQEETEKQIRLQTITSYHDLVAAQKAVAAARTQLSAAEKAFRVVEERYKEGQAQLIEYTDSRTTLTQSKQNLIIAVFDFKIREAELERIMADSIMF